jgi:hypothetical protein
MTAGFTAPGHWTETASQLRKSGQVTLNAAGIGTMTFDPDSANQRWVVTGVVIGTNQAATATVIPQCTIALNTTDVSQLSAANGQGTSWSGNNDTFSRAIDVGPCDFLSLMFFPAPGATGAQIAALNGVIANAMLTGTKYTRRA